MAINYATQVYTPAFNVFARPVTFTPLASQPSTPTPYDARGIYDTVPIDVLAEDQTIFSDTRTVLDILEYEFSVLPIQGDHVNIPSNVGMPALGDFEIIEVKSNGGGENIVITAQDCADQAMTSYPMMLRDKLMTKVQALSYFTGHGFHFHTNRSVQIQPQNIPFCGVYLIEAVGLPDGDANDAEVRLRTTARYGISVIVQNNDAAAAQSRLDEGLQAIETLYGDPTFYNWKNAGKPGEVAVQSFNRSNSVYSFGSIGADNEIPIAELRYDMTCDLGVITYPPTIVDDFNRLHLGTRYPLGADENVQQVLAQWDFLQNYSNGSAKIGGHISVAVNATII